MKVNSKKILFMGKAPTLGLMVDPTAVSGSIAKWKATELFIGATAEGTTETTKTILSTDLELLNGLMAKSTRGTGAKVSSMAGVYTIKMEKPRRESGETGRELTQ